MRASRLDHSMVRFFAHLEPNRKLLQHLPFSNVLELIARLPGAEEPNERIGVANILWYPGEKPVESQYHADFWRKREEHARAIARTRRSFRAKLEMKRLPLRTTVWPTTPSGHLWVAHNANGGKP